MNLDQQFVLDIKQILSHARSNAYHAVNHAMVNAYWEIGKKIVEKEQGGQERATYGEGLIKNLSKVLTGEFGKGFSIANLENFRKFYLTFPDWEKSYAARRVLSWTHYRSIIRVENPNAQTFYLKEAHEQGWSTRQLDRNIRSFYYERLLSSREKEETSHRMSENPEKIVSGDFIKDPYVFEFLNIPQPYDHSEKELESALIEHLQKFLLELGKGFSFVGRQFRISTEGSHFYIDLVFYNYILKCFVLFDLKVGLLTHQDIGQLDMYVRMFDDLKRIDGDNPTIGIILCAEKDQTVIKYSVLDGSEQLFASKYHPYLPTETELITEIEREKALFTRKEEEES